MLTKREIFDRVADHLIEQGRKSLRPRDGLCAYRGEDGTKCAVGALILDEFYNPVIEGQLVKKIEDQSLAESQRLLRSALELSGVPMVSHDDIQLLRELQKIHDMCEPADWADRLEELETEYFGSEGSTSHEGGTN